MTPAGFTMPIFPGTYHQGEPIYHKDGTLVDIPEQTYVTVDFTADSENGLPAGEYPLIFDLFTIGLDGQGRILTSDHQQRHLQA